MSKGRAFTPAQRPQLDAHHAQDILDFARQNLGLEGLEAPADVIDQARSYLEGNLTEEQLLTYVAAHYSNESSEQ